MALFTDGVHDDETVAEDSISNAQLRESAALSVIGRSANSTGNPADIAAVAASGAVLREASNVLGFGTIATAGIGNLQVTPAKLSALVTGATKGGSGKLIKTIQYNASGQIEAAVVEGVAGTDYLAPDWDVISRQTLGADAQEITFTVDGDSDERVEIEGFGESNASGACAIKFNATTVDVTKVTSVNGTTAGATTAAGASIADEAMGFRMIFDLRRQGTCDRGGIVQWWLAYGASTEEAYYSGVAFHDTSANITTIVLSGSVANFFASGFKVICRRRKMS